MRDVLFHDFPEIPGLRYSLTGKDGYLHSMKKTSFRAFLPYYRQCHSNRLNRWLHFTGASLFFGLNTAAFISQKYWLLPLAVFAGYLLPHIGHTHYEGNRSLRVSHPVYCVLGAALLYFEMWYTILAAPLRLLRHTPTVSL